MEIYPGLQIGRECTIDRLAMVGYEGKVKSDAVTVIGEQSVIEPFAIIYRGATLGKQSYVSAGASIYPGVVTGSNFYAANGASIREHATIGDNVRIGTNSLILPHATLKNGARVHSLVEVAEYSTIGEGAWVGPGVLMFNSKYPKRDDSDEKKRLDKEEAPIIGEYAIIGGGAILNPAVVIGPHSIVASGTRILPGTNVAPYSLVFEREGRIVMDHLLNHKNITEKYARLRAAIGEKP